MLLFVLLQATVTMNGVSKSQIGYGATEEKQTPSIKKERASSPEKASSPVMVKPDRDNHVSGCLMRGSNRGRASRSHSTGNDGALRRYGKVPPVISNAFIRNRPLNNPSGGSQNVQDIRNAMPLSASFIRTDAVAHKFQEEIGDALYKRKRGEINVLEQVSFAHSFCLN